MQEEPWNNVGELAMVEEGAGGGAATSKKNCHGSRSSIIANTSGNSQVQKTSGA
jgi:hypothetical protein